MRLYGKQMIRSSYEFLYKKHLDLIGNGGKIRAIGKCCLWLLNGCNERIFNAYVRRELWIRFMMTLINIEKL